MFSLCHTDRRMIKKHFHLTLKPNKKIVVLIAIFVFVIQKKKKNCYYLLTGKIVVSCHTRQVTKILSFPFIALHSHSIHTLLSVSKLYSLCLFINIQLNIQMKSWILCRPLNENFKRKITWDYSFIEFYYFKRDHHQKFIWLFCLNWE